MKNPEAGIASFDQDPDAIAWAREKIHAAIDRAHTAAAHGSDAQMTAKMQYAANVMQSWLLGNEDGCVLGAFDTRLPKLRRPLTRPSTAFEHAPGNVYTLSEDAAASVRDISEHPSITVPVEDRAEHAEDVRP